MVIWFCGNNNHFSAATELDWINNLGRCVSVMGPRRKPVKWIGRECKFIEILNHDKNYGKLTDLGWSSVLSFPASAWKLFHDLPPRVRLSAMKRRIKISFTTRKKWFAMTEGDKVGKAEVNLKAIAEAVNYISSSQMMTFQIGSDFETVMEKDLLSSSSCN